MLSIEQVIAIAKKHDLPVIVDAAGQVYPTENMGKYAKLGADMVAYGTKYIGTPHSAGMVVGSKTWINRVRLNSFISFEERRVRGIGRPQKIDRQEVVGVAAAVREWLTMNHEERIAKLDAKLTHIEKAITGIPGVRIEADRDPTGASVFNLMLHIDEGVTGISEDEVVARLKDGDPPVWTRVNPYFGGMQVGMVGLDDGEELVVADRMSAALKG